MDSFTAFHSHFLNNVNGNDDIDNFVGQNQGFDFPAAGVVVRIFKAKDKIKFNIFSISFIFVTKAVAYTGIITEIPIIVVVGRILNQVISAIHIPANNIAIAIKIYKEDVLIVVRCAEAKIDFVSGCGSVIQKHSIRVIQFAGKDASVVKGICHITQIQREFQIRHFYSSNTRCRHDSPVILRAVAAVCPNIPRSGRGEGDFQHTFLVGIHSALRVSIGFAVINFIADLRVESRQATIVPVRIASDKTQLQRFSHKSLIGVLQIAFGIGEIMEAGSAVTPEGPIGIMGNIQEITVRQYDLIGGQTPTVNGGIGTVKVITQIFVTKAKQSSRQINAAGATGDINIRPLQSQKEFVDINVQMQGGNFGDVVIVCIVNIFFQIIVCQINKQQFLQRNRHKAHSCSIRGGNKLSIITDGNIDLSFYQRF